MEIGFHTLFQIKFSSEYVKQLYMARQRSNSKFQKLVFEILLLIIILIVTLASFLAFPIHTSLSSKAIAAISTNFIVQIVLIILNLAHYLVWSQLDYNKAWLNSANCIIKVASSGNASCLIFYFLGEDGKLNFMTVQLSLMLFSVSYFYIVNCCAINYFAIVFGNIVYLLIDLFFKNGDLVVGRYDSIYYSFHFCGFALVLFAMEYNEKMQFLEGLNKNSFSSGFEGINSFKSQFSTIKVGMSLDNCKMLRLNYISSFNLPAALKKGSTNGQCIKLGVSSLKSKSRDITAYSLESKAALLSTNQARPSTFKYQEIMTETERLKSDKSEETTENQLIDFFSTRFKASNSIENIIIKNMIVSNGDTPKDDINRMIPKLLLKYYDLFKIYVEIGTKSFDVLSSTQTQTTSQIKTSKGKLNTLFQQKQSKVEQQYLVYGKMSKVGDNAENFILDIILVLQSNQSSQLNQEAIKKTKEHISKICHEFKTPLFNLDAIITQVDRHNIKLIKNFMCVLRKVNSTEAIKQKERIGKLIRKIYSGFRDVNSLAKYIISLTHDFNIKAQMESNYQLSVVNAKFSLSKFVKLIHKIFLIKIKSEYINKGSLKFNVIYDKHSCPQYLMTDEKRLMQVLLNLLSNSIKFTKAGEIVLKIEMQNGLLRFKVEDTGPGIPQEVMESFGNSWAKINNNEKNKDGSGLGLSIVCDIINKIGTNLNIESIQLKGTKISFDIVVHSQEVNDYFNEEDISLRPQEETDSGLSGSSDSSNNSSFCSEDSIDFKVKKLLGCDILEVNQTLPPEKEKDREVVQCSIANNNSNNITMLSGPTIKISNSFVNPQINMIEKQTSLIKRGTKRNTMYNRKVSIVDPVKLKQQLKQKSLSRNDVIAFNETNRFFEGKTNSLMYHEDTFTKLKLLSEDTIHAPLSPIEDVINILLVDDLKIMLDSHKAIIEKSFRLKKKKVKITVCEDGVECLDKLYKAMFKKQRFDAVITDSNMTFMSGDLLVHNIITLKNRNVLSGKLYIAMLTGHEYVDVKGVDQIFSKPFLEKHCLEVLNAITSTAY